MNYTSYSAVDFALDEQFRRWVISPTHDQEAYWQSFLAKHPEQQAVIDEARALVSRVRVNVEEASPATLQRMWAVIQQASPEYANVPDADDSDDQTPVFPLGGLPLSEPTRRMWWQSAAVRVAAMLAGVLLLGGLLYRQLRAADPALYQTAFGKTQTITLPDGSVVTLNGNSKLMVPPNWEQQEARVVSLDGEAFFSVKKQRSAGGQPVKFRVQTPDLTVEVLGTQFNVSHRRNQTEVVLQEGRVQITEAQLGRGSGNTQPTLMQPGERVTYSASNRRFEKQAVDTRLFTSWQANLLIFKDTPVATIAQQLQDSYGLRIDIRAAGLGQRKFTGSIPTDSVPLFFAKLEKLYGVTVRQEAGQYIID